jgi:NAD(P)H-dependent flavin oxidoreductase YrpB (nitropropane dioxygenase family)
MFPKLNSEDTSLIEMKKKLPDAHVKFAAGLAEKYRIPPATKPHFFTDTARSQSFFNRQLDVVLESDVDMVACAVGVPADVIGRIKARNKIALALVGSAKHAHAALSAGVDILVAQGTDAGGHTGPVGTFTLVPQVIEVAANVPVVAAGGVGHGRQIAAALAMGAQGAWLGTIWLTTREHDLSKAITDKLIAAGSEDTLLTRAHSGKSCRILKSAWTDEWHAPGSPEPLKMPYQHALTGGLLAAIEEHEVLPLLYTPAGQSVAWSRSVESTRDVMDRLVSETRQALDALVSHLNVR